MEATEFLQKFRKLDGVTVAEKKKSFGKLMHEAKSVLQDPIASKDILTNLEAKTYLENQFRVEILLSSRCVPELFELLKNGDEALICKIIKHKWLFKEIFREVTTSQIMNDLLPQLSYCVRIKLLNGLKIAFENEEKLSELFDCYKTKYGLPAALPILFACSVEKIESVIKSEPVFLAKSQVWKLLKKEPKLFLVYVEEHVKHRGECRYLLDDYQFRKMLSSKYYDIFELLQKKHHFHIIYGRNTTKKIFDKEKDQILADPAKYRDSLKLSVFVRKLGENGRFKQYFKSVFPESVEQFSPNHHQIKPLLSHYPKTKRYQLLKETFEEVYNVSFMDCPNKIDESLLQLMCHKQYSKVRCQMAAVKRKATRNSDYAVYQRTAKSIPFLKREINLSSNTAQRKRLIKLLANTCKVNKDLDSLVEVVQYVAARHKNESEVVYEFLRYIELQFDMHEFKKELWDVIIELVDLHSLMNPKADNYERILLHYTEFKYNSGEVIKEWIAKYMTRDECGTYLFGHDCKNGKFLQQAIKEFVVLFLEKDEKEKSNYFYLFNDLNNWNLKHQEFTVSYLDFPELLDNMLKLAKAENHNFSISDLVCSKDRNYFIEELSDAFWQKHDNQAGSKQIVYFFRWYPSLLLRYNNAFLNGADLYFNRMEYVLRWMKRYDHLEFPQTVVKFCQDKVCSERKVDSEVKFDYLFAMLIRFMTTQDFVNYIEKYKPKDLSLDNWENEEKGLYHLRCSVTRSFKYTEHATEMFPFLMTYCGGDFLKHILVSLYKYFHHSPCNSMQPYLDQLASGAVSVRKHALFLTSRISGLESSEIVLRSCISTEKNMSLQKKYMLMALYSFLKYHSSNYWELFITSLASLKDNDKESFQKLVQPKKFIPKSYFALYYQEIWNLIERRNFHSSLKYTLRNNLTNKIYSSIDLFPAEFCYKVIDTLLLKFSDDNAYNSNINTFVYNFLLRHKDPDRFSKILEILQSAKTSQADDSKFKQKVKGEICSFINRLCSFYYSCEENEKWDKNLLQDFADKLLSLYPPVEILPDYLLLSFTSKLIASKDLKDYAQKTSILLDELFETFGVYILEKLSTTICCTLKFFYTGDKSKNATFEFIHELLKMKSTEVNQVLCLSMSLQRGNNLKPGFKEFLKIFDESTVPYIQFRLLEHRKN